MTEAVSSQRIDKWLWHARFIKTRSLSQKLVKAGKVRVNREKITNPSHPVKPENVLTLTLAREIKIIRVIAIGNRRGPYEEAKELYADLTPEVAKPETNIETTPRQAMIKTEGKPSKHQRKEILALKRNSTS